MVVVIFTAAKEQVRWSRTKIVTSGRRWERVGPLFVWNKKSAEFFKLSSWTCIMWHGYICNWDHHHPSLLLYPCPGSGHGGSRLCRVFQMSLSTAMLWSSSSGIVSLTRYAIPAASFVSALMSPPSWSCPENIPKGGTQEASHTSAGSFQCKAAVALIWAPRLIAKAALVGNSFHKDHGYFQAKQRCSPKSNQVVVSPQLNQTTSTRGCYIRCFKNGEIRCFRIHHQSTLFSCLGMRMCYISRAFIGFFFTC